MTGLALPALDGRSPLGFLAALGLLRLVAEHRYPEARLSWSRSDCSAVLHDAHTTIEQLVADLGEIVASIPSDGVLPELPVDFPPPGEAPDKLRLLRKDKDENPFRQRVRDVWDTAGPAGERWLASLVTDLSTDDRGRVDISLYTAPSGKQSMRTMLEKPLAFVRKHPQTLTEALIGWRRYPEVTGEYLDHQVLFDAADAPDGKSRERGVPGATWLALMSYPLLRTTAARGEPISTGWQFSSRRTTSRRLVYPLWERPLDSHGVIALVEHPVLLGAQPGRPSRVAQVLTVFLVCVAERQRLPGRTFAGVLTPVRASRGARAADAAQENTGASSTGGSSGAVIV